MARFVTDSSLDYVARRLRFLGYDVVTVPGARLEELFDAARRDDRTVLTLSVRHPKAFADVRVLTLPRGDAAAAVRRIAEGHEAVGAPFSRCPADNTALQRRLPMEAMGEVPGRVLRRSPRLDYCPTCGKWYWDGSHVARVREWLEHALGRSLSSPEPPDAGRAPA
jgi:uncharacterized protein with PIN domain